MLFHTARPDDGKVPVFNSSRWSWYSSGPLQIQGSTPRLFISSEYGASENQQELKEKFVDGNPDGRHAIMYLDVEGYNGAEVDQFQQAFEDVATKYVTETLHPVAVKGKKRGSSLTISPLLSDNSNKGVKSIKVKATYDVLLDMYNSVSEELRGETLLDFPRDSIFKYIFEITGVWHNTNQFGFTVKLRRGKWVRTVGPPKQVKPVDYDFVDEADDADDANEGLESGEIGFA
jgi:hypothetical protein